MAHNPKLKKVKAYYSRDSSTRDESANPQSDDDDDEMDMLHVDQIDAISDGANHMQAKSAQWKTVHLTTTHDKKEISVSGRIHNIVQHSWLDVSFCAESRGKNMYKLPVENNCLGYEVADAKRVDVNLIRQFFKDCGISPEHSDIFFNKIREWGCSQNLSFQNLNKYLEDFRLSVVDEDVAVSITKLVSNSESGRIMNFCLKFPNLMKYLPHILPTRLESIMETVNTEYLDDMEKAITRKTWMFAFDNVMRKNFHMIGCEAKITALKNSEPWQDLSHLAENAIEVYQMLKADSRNGHTFMFVNWLRKKMNAKKMGPVELDKALRFLEKKLVVTIDQERVFLTRMFQCEKDIAKELCGIIRGHAESDNPLKLEVDWTSKHLQKVLDDNDQKTAADLICEQGVVALTGKGGCGKTTVISGVVRAYRDMLTKKAVEAQGTEQQELLEEDMENNEEHEVDEEEITPNHKLPQSSSILITAPTGKAANLIGISSGIQAFTLHHVIFSYRSFVKARKQSEQEQNEKPEWKFRGIEMLVVDECSLVSVTVFHSMLKMLVNGASLRKVILLGDVKQLPSIEPGNFLSDVLDVLDRHHCAVYLEKNWRTERALLVENATEISLKRMPVFDPERHFTAIRLLPTDELTDTIRELLKTSPHLRDPMKSQFITFERENCRKINGMACLHYNKHPTKDHRGQFDFRIGDKICLTRNANVTLLNKDGGVDVQTLGDIPLSDTQRNTRTNVKDTSEVSEMRLCNGEIFMITDWTEKQERGKKITMVSLKDTLGLEITVDMKDLKSCKMQHAWARTIHTFQGSETPVVVYVVGEPKGQNWQHVYTAVTRGKQEVMVVYEEGKLRSVVEREPFRRFSSLKTCLNKEIDAAMRECNMKFPTPRKNPPPSGSSASKYQKTPQKSTTSNTKTPSSTLRGMSLNSPNQNQSNHVAQATAASAVRQDLQKRFDEDDDISDSELEKAVEDVEDSIKLQTPQKRRHDGNPNK